MSLVLPPKFVLVVLLSHLDSERRRGKVQVTLLCTSRSCVVEYRITLPLSHESFPRVSFPPTHRTMAASLPGLLARELAKTLLFSFFFFSFFRFRWNRLYSRFLRVKPHLCSRVLTLPRSPGQAPARSFWQDGRRRFRGRKNALRRLMSFWPFLAMISGGQIGAMITCQVRSGWWRFLKRQQSLRSKDTDPSHHELGLSYCAETQNSLPNAAS